MFDSLPGVLTMPASEQFDVVQAVEAALHAYAGFHAEMYEPGQPFPDLVEIEQCCSNRALVTIVGWLQALVNRVVLAEAHICERSPIAEVYHRVCREKTDAEQKLEATRIDLRDCRNKLNVYQRAYDSQREEIALFRSEALKCKSTPAPKDPAWPAI